MFDFLLDLCVKEFSRVFKSEYSIGLELGLGSLGLLSITLVTVDLEQCIILLVPQFHVRILHVSSRIHRLPSRTIFSGTARPNLGFGEEYPPFRRPKRDLHDWG